MGAHRSTRRALAAALLLSVAALGLAGSLKQAVAPHEGPDRPFLPARLLKQFTPIPTAAPPVNYSTSYLGGIALVSCDVSECLPGFQVDPLTIIPDTVHVPMEPGLAFAPSRRVSYTYDIPNDGVPHSVDFEYETGYERDWEPGNLGIISGVRAGFMSYITVYLHYKNDVTGEQTMTCIGTSRPFTGFMRQSRYRALITAQPTETIRLYVFGFGFARQDLSSPSGFWSVNGSWGPLDQLDSDGDGVTDLYDLCQMTSIREIFSMNGLANRVSRQPRWMGCAVSDICFCDLYAVTNDKEGFYQCVVDATQSFLEEGVWSAHEVCQIREAAKMGPWCADNPTSLNAVVNGSFEKADPTSLSPIPWDESLSDPAVTQLAAPAISSASSGITAASGTYYYQFRSDNQGVPVSLQQDLIFNFRGPYTLSFAYRALADPTGEQLDIYLDDTLLTSVGGPGSTNTSAGAWTPISIPLDSAPQISTVRFVPVLPAGPNAVGNLIDNVVLMFANYPVP